MLGRVIFLRVVGDIGRGRGRFSLIVGDFVFLVVFLWGLGIGFGVGVLLKEEFWGCVGIVFRGDFGSCFE